MKSFLQVFLVYGLYLILIFINYPVITRYYDTKNAELETSRANAASLTGQIYGLKTEISQIEQENTRLLAEKPELEKKIADLKNKFLTAEKFPAFLKDLQTVCLSNNIEIITLEQTVAKEFTGKYYRSTFRLNARGTYSNLTKFLGQTESFSYLLTIKDFSILGVDTKTGILNVRLNMMIYLRENKA